MVKGRGVDVGRICSRCGARADARRGATPVCLTCGHPFPTAGVAATVLTPPPSSRSGAPVGLIAGLFFGVCAFCAIVMVAVFAMRQSGSSTASAPSAVADAAALLAPVVAQAASASAAPSASASARPALTDAERDELEGEYTCSIDDTAPFRCRIAGGQLEKLAGSQRFRGPVKKLPNGNLSFVGTFFCPFGDCTRPISSTFVRQGPGRYVGSFPPSEQGPGKERVVLVKVR